MAPITTLLTLALTLATTTVTALPSHAYAPYALPPNSTSVTYYQGTVTPSSCGIAVSSGNLTRGTCYRMYTNSIGVKQVAGHGCEFRLWEGEGCKGGYKKCEVQKGNGSTCVDVGVLDGGRYDVVSGMWSC